MGRHESPGRRRTGRREGRGAGRGGVAEGKGEETKGDKRGRVDENVMIKGQAGIIKRHRRSNKLGFETRLRSVCQSGLVLSGHTSISHSSAASPRQIKYNPEPN